MTGSWHFKVVAFAFTACVLLGGGTRPGFLSDAVLQMTCIPLLCWTLWRMPNVPLPEGGRLAIVLLGAVVALPAFQLAPLPLSIWQGFAARASELSVVGLVGRAPASLPITVSPQATVLSALALIPPVTVFLTVLQQSAQERRLMTLLLIALGVASSFLGLAQLSQGPQSSLRFFEFTNVQDAVGFFANRNHFSTFINCTIVFAIAWTLDAASRPWRDRSRRTIVLIAGVTVIVVLIAGAAMARSRAGVAGTAIALVAGFALALRVRRATSGLTPMRVLAGGIVFGMLLAVQFALYRLLDRFAVDPLQDARADFARVTFEAIKAYFPFGSGLGTFTRVYPTFEKPHQALVDTFVNRAHNDFLEFALEAGVFGGLLVGAAGAVATAFGWRAWTRKDVDARSIDATLARAGTIALAIIALHSALDYPLRTAAVMALFALALALLLEVKSEASPEEPKGTEDLSRPDPIVNVDMPTPGTPFPPAAASKRKPWGIGTEWPEEWRKK